MPISVVIITFNEEKNIARCLDSLTDIADEIIVLDSFSTDKTAQICALYPNVTFSQREWAGYAESKNYANSLALHDYILSLDADECVSDTLKQSILKAKKNGLKGIYAMNRLTNYCGKWIHHSGWYPDQKTRLFPKNKSHWEGQYVHEKLVFSEKMLKTVLKGDCLHYSYYTFAEHRERANKYAILSAQQFAANGKKVCFLTPYFKVVGRFISMYVLRLGFLDGFMGFKIAQISAKSNFVKYQTLRKLNRINR